MATFRSNAGIVLALICLACTPGRPGAEPAPAAEAAIARQGIEHVTPRRDSVGAAPAKLEWTGVAGVDSYSITVMNEVDALIFDAQGVTATSLDWPKAMTLDSGTYFWRVVGIKDGRTVADSGRSAFVVTQ